MDRAIALAGFRSCESTVINLLIEQSKTIPRLKGVPEPVPVNLSASQISGEFDIDRPSVSKAIRRLIERNMIVSHGPGLLVNEQFEQWVGTNGRPQFTPKQLEAIGKDPTLWCVSQHTDGVSRKTQTTVKGVSHETQEVCLTTHSQVSEVCLTTHSDCVSQHTLPVSYNTQRNRPPQTPLIGTGAELELRETKEEVVVKNNSSVAGTHAGAREAEPDFSMAAVKARVRALVEAAAPNFVDCVPWPSWVASGYPPQWCEKAIKLAIVSAEPRGVMAYANKVLIAWYLKGDCEDETTPRLGVFGERPARERPLSPTQAKQQRSEAFLRAEIEARRQAVARA